MNIVERAQDLEGKILAHPFVQRFRAPLKEGTSYNDAWIMFDVDQVHIEYTTKNLQTGFQIAARNGEARVIIVWTLRQQLGWGPEGIGEIELSACLQRAIGLCEFLWNQSMLQSEGMYPMVSVTIDAV